MSTFFKAWAAKTNTGPLERFDFDPGTMHEEDVEIVVEHAASAIPIWP